MSKSNSLVSIGKHQNEIVRTVLTNTIKMLTNRGLLLKDNLESNIKHIVEKQSEEQKYSVKLDKKIADVKNELMITFLPYNITSINKTSSIFDFLNTYKDNLSIIIVKTISRRANEDVSDKFPNAEIFLEKDLMIDKMSYSYVPEHILLTDEQKDDFYKQYNIKKKNMLKIHSTDPISQYFNAKPGDVFRIKRPSPTSGYVNVYRLVVKG